MRRIGWMAALLLGLAPAARAEGPAGAQWLATGVGEFALTPDDDVTLDFEADRISGRSGCNRYFGAVTLTAVTPGQGALALGPVAGTRMACPGRAEQIELSFLAALGQIDAWRIERDGTLTLLAQGAPLITARPR